MADFQFNPALLRIGAIRRLQDAINRPRPEGSGAATWAAPFLIILLLASVGITLLIEELASHNKGLQRLAIYPAAGLFLPVFLPLFIATHFFPKPRKWVRWTVWSLTVFGLLAAVLVGTLAFGLVNGHPDVAGLIMRAIGWSLVGIAAFSIVLLSVDLWRRRRGNAKEAGVI